MQRLHRECDALLKPLLDQLKVGWIALACAKRVCCADTNVYVCAFRRLYYDVKVPAVHRAAVPV
jgi:hypothetical protein